jgi:GNAT superfamily N-acetyltransferase
MSEPSSVTIRRATPEDYDAIMAMPLVYEGHDYLPFVLRKWLDDTLRTTLIATVDNDVIGLDSVVRLDANGKTVISQALRVHPAHRGKGVSSLLQRAVADVVAASGATRMRISTYRENTVSLNQHLALGFTVLPDEFFGPFGALAPVLPHLEALRALAGGVRVVDTNEIGFPDAVQVGITDWTPFDPTPEGVASVNRFSLAPIRFAVSERADGSRVFSHHQFSRESRELYASIYESDHFFAHMLHHIEAAIGVPTVKYLAFHCHKSSTQSHDQQGRAWLDAAFERDEFNASFTNVVVLERAIVVKEQVPESAQQSEQ